MGQEASKPDPDVKLQVIGCGMSRTGTASFSEAMKILLGGPVYHGGSQLVDGGEAHIRAWIHVQKHTPIKSEEDRKVVMEGVKALVSGYTGLTDTPPILFTEELVELFPDAKFICTIRDPDSWWRSMEGIAAKTDTKAEQNERVLAWLLAWLPTMRYWDEFSESLRQGRFGELFYQSGHRHPHPGQYAEHMAYVERVVPPERLVLYDIKDGWEPLCKILDCEIPGVPFPRVNDGEATDKVIRKVIRRAVMSWIGVGAGTVLVLGVLTRQIWH